MIELKGVTKQYLYGARVLGATEMCINDGEIVAIIGGEGAGKSTLLKVIAGVTDCEGEVLICGNPVSKRPDDVLMVFDDLAVFANRSFYYNLAYPLKIRGVDKFETDKRVKTAAERLGITACLYEKVRKMPLIDVKRLALARLYLRDYKALLIDDITHGLSRSEADELWAEAVPILIEKAKQGVSVLFATENADEALSVADRIAVLHCGEIKQVGRADEIYNNPSNIWAAQSLDKYYHFERARLDRSGGKPTVTLGVRTPVSEADEYTLDGSVFDGRIADGYEGKDIFIGWHAEDFAEDGAYGECEECGEYDDERGRENYERGNQGNRVESVEYAVYEDGKYILHTQSGICVKSNIKKTKVCTLPDIRKAVLYDFSNENSLFL